MSEFFSTDTITPKERLSYWNEVICRTYLTVECALAEEAFIAGSVTVNRLGQLEVSEVFSPPMAYRRRPDELRVHHEEHYQLVMLVGGKGVLQQDGREVEFAPGDIALYSAARPSVFASAGSQTIVFKIPRPLFIDRVADADCFTAMKLRADNPITKMVGGLMHSSLGIAACEQVRTDSTLVGGMLDIVAAALEGLSAGAFSGSGRRSQLNQIKGFIRQSLSDPELHVDQIATSNNVSVRTLNRLFASEGTTAVKWLWDQRLAASYRLLAERRVRQVSEAALSCGFNDLSHFSKAFKREFSCSPNELLSGRRGALC